MEHLLFALCFVGKLTITQKSGLFHFFIFAWIWGKAPLLFDWLKYYAVFAGSLYGTAICERILFFDPLCWLTFL
jgi:hypothetical protein